MFSCNVANPPEECFEKIDMDGDGVIQQSWLIPGWGSIRILDLGDLIPFVNRFSRDGNGNPAYELPVAAGPSAMKWRSEFAEGSYEADNCKGIYNLAQADTDGDGHGNRCDCDIDNNNVCDAIDEYWLSYCIEQAPTFALCIERGDMNADGILNATDKDLFDSLFPYGIGLTRDFSVTVQPGALAIGLDLDGDNIPNTRDICLRDYDPEQLDSDGDGIGDACDD